MSAECEGTRMRGRTVPAGIDALRLKMVNGTPTANEGRMGCQEATNGDHRDRARRTSLRLGTRMNQGRFYSK